MQSETDILKRIDAFARDNGIDKPGRITKRACGNYALYDRLCRGGECLPRTQKKLEDFMARGWDDGRRKRSAVDQVGVSQ